MSDRPFHHGNLRAALLDEAVSVLRTDGIDALSLRDLARRVGVSHGAPRSHFVDRQALLDALAVRGFTRLTTQVERAVEGDGSPTERSRRLAQAYVDFAIDDAALMELMFRAKADGRAPAVQQAADRLFATLDAAMPTDRTGDERWTAKLLFAATMQGIAGLVTSRRIDRAQGDRLVGAAVEGLRG